MCVKFNINFEFIVRVKYQLVEQEYNYLFHTHLQSVENCN